MANLFNSNPLMGLGFALSTFGGQQSMGNAMNLLNFAQRQKLIDAEQEKELKKEARAASYLKNTGKLDLAEGGMQSRPLTIGEQVFNGYGPTTDPNKVDLMRAAGPSNLLNAQISSAMKADEPYTLGPNDKRMVGGRVVAENIIPQKQDIPSDAALVKYYQSLPGGPEKAQLGAIIQQKIQGAPKVTWKRLKPEEATAAGLPEGGVYEESSDGQTRAVTTPSRDPGTLKLKEMENAAAPLMSALSDFETQIDKSTMWDRANALSGGTSPAGKALNTTWTNAALMAKGEALFNLGVLSGPDLDILRNALTDPSTVRGFATGKQAYKAGIAQVRKLVNDRLLSARQTYGSVPAQPPAQASPQGTAGWSIVRVK